MLTKTQFWTLTAAGAVALALALANMYLFQSNRAMQAKANGRAQFIQQSVALENLYRQIVQELADRAVKTRDDQIREMLAAEGVNLTFEDKPAKSQGDAK